MSTLVQAPAKRKARRIANFVPPVETPQVVVEPTPIVEVVIPAPAPAPRPVHRSENLDIILSAAAPATTKTYSPLSHLDLITSVKEQLDKRGLTIKDERYSQNRNGQQMFGHMTVEGYNGDQDMCLGFRNSYDKSMHAARLILVSVYAGLL
jgi:hypothetical protein